MKDKAWQEVVEWYVCVYILTKVDLDLNAKKCELFYLKNYPPTLKTHLNVYTSYDKITFNSTPIAIRSITDSSTTVNHGHL